MTAPRLVIDELCVDYLTQAGLFRAADRVSFTIAPGEVFGLAGESGSGKSTVAYAISRLHGSAARISGGRITLDGTDVLALNGRALRRFRWRDVSMAFQSAMNSLNPVLRVSQQFRDMLRTHTRASNREADAKAQGLLELVGIEPGRLHDYPHQFSGGMRQRIVLAMALALEPKLVILDEPTTALDVVVQREILQQIHDLRRRFGFSVLFITHDLALMAQFCDRIGIMKDGVLVEQGPATAIRTDPQHPYTKALWAALPLITGAPDAEPPREPSPGDLAKTPAALEARGLEMVFRPRVGWRRVPRRVLRDISFSLAPQHCLALVGESGSGKSTCAKLLTGVHAPTAGEIHFDGAAMPRRLGDRARLVYRRAVQMVFQDPFSALNPTHTVFHHLARPLDRHRLARGGESLRRRIEELMHQVELDPEQTLPKYPHQLSGGQRQRVNLARALAVEPRVLIADEPTSMLDVSIRRGILDLLDRLKRERDLALLYITHDIATARYVADEIAVLYAGQIVEWGATDRVIDRPQHPYTRLLLSAVPDPTTSLATLSADEPNFAVQADAVRRDAARLADRIVAIDDRHFVRLSGQGAAV